MTYRYLTGLADILRANGLKVQEIPGWKDRGRPSSTGGFNPVGVLCHHTATGPSSSNDSVLRLLVQGRSDLPGPLCQLGLGRDGTVYVVAAGRANHAGTAKASGTVAGGDGNYLYIGIEAFNDGRGEPWPAAQYDAYVKLCAVLCLKVTGNSAQTVRGHKETSVTGKIDPTFSMDAFRERVAAQMKAMGGPVMPPPAPPKPPSKGIIRRLRARIRRLRKHLRRHHQEQPTPPPDPDPPQPGTVVTHAHTSGRFDESKADLEALTDSLYRRATVVTGTEVARDGRAAKLAEKGMNVYNGTEAPGADECFIATRADVWERLAERAAVVTRLPYFSQGGKKKPPLHIIATVDRNRETGFVLLTTCGHYPSSVQGSHGGMWSGKPRVKTYKDGIKGTRRVVAELASQFHPDGVMICGDFNLDITHRAVRAWFAGQFPGYTPTWPVKPKGKGTLGRRWIDVTFAKGLRVVDGPEVEHTDASDHRAYIERLEGL